MELKEAIRMTQRVLMNINVPAGFIKDIGMQIAVAIDNLEQICIALENNNKDKPEESGDEGNDADGND